MGKRGKSTRSSGEPHRLDFAACARQALAPPMARVLRFTIGVTVAALAPGCGGGGSSAAAGGGDAATGPDVIQTGDVGTDVVQADVAETDAGCNGDASDCAASPLGACLAYAQAYCAKYLTCNPSGLRTIFGTVEVCQHREALGCPDQFTANGSSLTVAMLASCTQTRSAQACAEFLSDPTTNCVFAGSLANGSACEYDAQCQSTKCLRGTDWCGTCQPRLASGATCDPLQSSCEIGLRCANVLCSGQDGGGCQASTNQTTCTKIVYEGGACADNSQCGGNLLCLQGVCAVGKQLGDTCTALDECDASEELYCTPNSTGSQYACTPVLYAAAGERCDYTAGAFCLANGTCRDADGGASATGTCSAAPADGQPCDPVSRCLSPARCVNAACEAPVPPSSCK